MKRKARLARHAPVKRVNRERAAKRKARDFGEYANWIRTLPCCITSRRTGERAVRPYGLEMALPVHAAHVRSRGAGGHAEGNLVPLNAWHHMELHRIGRQSFAEKYSVDLGAIAADLWGRYQRETKGDVA